MKAKSGQSLFRRCQASPQSALFLAPWLRHLHVHDASRRIGLLGWNPVHEHPTGAREVGAGQEVTLAPADDEEVAHPEGLPLVEVEEDIVDARPVRHRIDVGQHLCLVPVGDLVHPLHRAVGAFHVLQRIRQFGLTPRDRQADGLLLEAHLKFLSVVLHRHFLLGLRLSGQHEELRWLGWPDGLGREPGDAEGDDLRRRAAGLHAVGVAAEQDAVASEGDRDALQRESRLRELQPPLLVQPEG